MKDSTSMLILSGMFFVVSGAVFGAVSYAHSPWWLLLLALLWGGMRIRFNDTATCPKCGHIFVVKTDDEKEEE